MVMRTRQNAPKRKGLVVSVQLQGLMDILRMEKKKSVNIACSREYVKQFNVNFKVKSGRMLRGRSKPQGMVKCSLGGKVFKIRTTKQKQMKNKKHLVSKFDEGRNDDYFATRKRRRKFGWFWKGKLLPDKGSSSDEADEDDQLSELTFVEQSKKEDPEEKDSMAYGVRKILEENSVQRQAVDQTFEVKGPQKMGRSFVNVSPSHWCSAVASYNSRVARMRHGTPKLWRSPSPRLWTEKQHAAFQSRKLKEISSRNGKSRNVNLVKCLQKEFNKEEVFVKKDDIVSMEKGGNGSAQSWQLKTGGGFGGLLAKINCAVVQKEEDCSGSECEEYFSDM